MLKRSIKLLEQDAVTVARKLIGCRLYVRESDGSLTGGMIIETEAYTQEDAASHTFKGQTLRNQVMFGPAGRLYVYFTYGMHWCANIVTGPEGHGEGVLIRAITPDSGIEIIRQRRHNRPDYELTNGPAKLCQALAVDGRDNGLVVNNSRVILRTGEVPENSQIINTERIGIKQDKHRLWRFALHTI